MFTERAPRSPRSSVHCSLIVAIAAVSLAACDPLVSVHVLSAATLTSEGESDAVSCVDPRLAAHTEDCCAPGGLDSDSDGLPDACEDNLGARFAPVVYHSSDETNFPTNVDAFLAKSALFYYDDACNPDLAVRIVTAPTQPQLLGQRVIGSCGAREMATSGGTRSSGKRRTFFLADVAPSERGGARDSAEWTTYLHAYPSEAGTVTLQYWRFYAYNDAFNDHGGDWEGIHVVLDSAKRPMKVRLLGHGDMRELAASNLTWEGDHVRVFSEGGGHGTRASSSGIVARGCNDADPCEVDLHNRATFIRHETWPGGRVSWPQGGTTKAGRLVDVGEKRAPMNGQLFVQYSGLWGSPGGFFWTSGYWGPAYNETSMRDDGFVTAWCAGMASDALKRECWAAGRVR